MQLKKLKLKTGRHDTDKPYLGYAIDEADKLIQQVKPYLIGQTLEQILIYRFYGMDDYEKDEKYFDYEYRHPVLNTYEGHSYYHYANWEGPLILKFGDIRFEAQMWAADCYELGVNTIKIRKIYDAKKFGLNIISSLKGEKEDVFIDISTVLGQLIGRKVVDVKLQSAVNAAVGTTLAAILFYLEDGKKFAVFNNDDFIDIDAEVS